MLILTKARDSFRLGRFVLHIDDFAKLIRVQVLNGPSPGPMERRNIEKYIKVQRPDIMPSTEIHTGWGFESSIDIHI
jgi:hypothetical protein